MSNRPDVDTIDNILGDAVRLSIGTLTQIIGAITRLHHPTLLPHRCHGYLDCIILGGDLLPAERP